MIAEGRPYTNGNSFRAKAETLARRYRATDMQLTGFDKYGHILTDPDAQLGMNFLPSYRAAIMDALQRRNEDGKGIDLDRTTKNMLSSQAMCFNLFVPLALDKAFAAKCLNGIIGDVSIVRSIQIEFTPPNKVFHDQTLLSGVDCDALIVYQKRDGCHALAVVETKFVEQEFSICGFRKHTQRNKCPEGTKAGSDFAGCRYHHLKKYKYWEVSDRSGIFDMNSLRTQPCPFGGMLWQLWTNQALAFALTKELNCQEYKYLILYPAANTELTHSGSVFDQFRTHLISSEHFQPIALEKLMSELQTNAIGNQSEKWVKEFVARYDVLSSATSNKQNNARG